VGAYGIKRLSNPLNKEEANEMMDAVLVPLVAFTESKHRIGEGGGYYDLFISKCRSLGGMQHRKRSGSIKFIGVALESLKIEGNESEIFS
jgi:5-formyltetrahydrofolate cyclo-ligase